MNRKHQNRNYNFVRSSFSRTSLLAFAVVFAVTGAYLIYRSFAAGTTTTTTSTTSSNTAGDLNNDGKIDILDLSLLLSNYSKTTTTGDLNNDGKVDVLDLSTLLSHYGQTVTTANPGSGTTTPPTSNNPIPANATLLVHTDFQNGTLSGWHLQCLSTRWSMPDEGGNRFFRSEVRQGDIEPETGNNRCQITGPPSGSTGTSSNGNFAAGEYWYQARTRLVQGFPGNQWSLIQQWHESPGIGAVDLANFIESGPTMHLYGENISSNLRTPAIDSNWHTYTYHFKFGTSGFAEEWFDGQYIGRIDGTTLTTATWYPVIGIYRAAATTSGTMIADIDDISIYRP